MNLEKRFVLEFPLPFPLCFFSDLLLRHPYHAGHGAVPGREHPPPVEEGPAAPLEEPRHVLAGVRHEVLYKKSGVFKVSKNRFSRIVFRRLNIKKVVMCLHFITNARQKDNRILF